jgi:VWFA-related protein
MRLLFIGVMLAALARAGHAAQDAQRPADVFRGRVDLITIDVSAVDSKEKPIEDLRARDFAVKIDGKIRPVLSAELIKVDRARTLPPVRPVDALITTNATAPDARRIVLAVDQTLITPGAITPLLRTAGQFVDRLAPVDYSAFIGFPEPGPRVDFTTDRAKVRTAMAGIVGQPSKRGDRKFNIAVWEGFALTGGERPAASSLPDRPTTSTKDLIQLLLEPPTMRRIFERGCEDKTFDELNPDEMELAMMTADEVRELLERLKRCRALIYQESMTIVSDARQEAQLSLRALEALLKDLALIDGPKTMIVMSAGLVNDDPSVLSEVAELAAAARTTINVIAVDHERDQEIRSFGANQPGGSLIDRSYEMQGLEIIADSTGGSLYRSVGGTSEGVFQGIESKLSAWYLLAVERQPGDPERQRVSVEVKRKGVTVRSNKTFVSTAAVNARRPIDEVLRDALSSSLAVPGIPLRVATFAQRDATSGKYRLRLVAQIGQPGEKPGEFAVGYALMGGNGRPVTTAASRRTLNPPPGGANQPLNYESAISVAPGVYSLRVGVVDRNGRRGTVVHRVELPPLIGDEISTSDLIVGRLPGPEETLGPGVEPQVTTGELAGYLELYLTDADRDRVTVTLEIAEGESSPALATEPLPLRAGEQPSWRVASGYVDVAVAPGRYIARAIVRRDGNVVRTLSRAVTIARDPAVAVKAPPLRRGLPVSADLRRRTAAYIASMVNGLANLVAQEEFTLSKPDRRVRSDLLLVRYPGTQRDLLSYRDAVQLNGAPIAGREERLLDLFAQPTDHLREQARRIMRAAEAYVPSMFNPMFVLGFLQTDFQSRFELTVNDAGPGWPREVKAVTFVEVGRPTMLRLGVFEDIDVPTRGTAWIEEGTGRVLQTELQIGRGKSLPTMVTKFKLDERLQVTVPVEMRTQNPDGVATYTNFRRFGVDTETKIPTPPTPQQ